MAEMPLTYVIIGSIDIENHAGDVGIERFFVCGLWPHF